MGALGGARAAIRARSTVRRSTPLDNSESQTGLPLRTWQLPLRPSGALAALPHRAQSSVRVNATLQVLVG